MSLEEFTGFAYPELYQHMRRALVQETIERYDRDENKEVTVYELLNKKFKYDRFQADQFSKGKKQNLLKCYLTEIKDVTDIKTSPQGSPHVISSTILHPRALQHHYNTTTTSQ